MEFKSTPLTVKTCFLSFSGAFFLFWGLISCSPGKQSESANDSLKTDSTIGLGDSNRTNSASQLENSQSKAFAISNFPTFSTATYTSYEEEVVAMNGLQQLMARYETARLFLMESNCRLEEEEEIGPGETVQSTQNENLKVFYDSYNNPLAAVWTESYTAEGSDKHYYNTEHFIFEKNSLVGYAADVDDYMDANVKRYSRATARQCPTCGVLLTSGVSSAELKLSTLDASTFQFTETEILEKVNAQRNSIIGNELTFKDNQYYTITLSAIRPNGKSCPTDFFVDKVLFEKYYKEFGD